jgi:hypothetical protein
MKTVNLLLAGLVASSAFSVPSHAFELAGAWTTDSSICPKLFSKTAKAISFKRDSEDHGKGFIVAGNVIRGPRTKCVIKARTENGSETRLLASCASEIMVDQVQVNFKVVDDNKIVRLFPGMETFETAYVRCAF